MLRVTLELLRRGKPRPRPSLLFDKYRRIPSTLKPEQLGQQYFSEFLIRNANNEEIERQEQEQWQRYNYNINNNYNNNNSSNNTSMPYSQRQDHRERNEENNNNSNSNSNNNEMNVGKNGIYPVMPQMDVYNMLDKTSTEHIAKEMEEVIRNDAFQSQRVFNERMWLNEERERIKEFEQESQKWLEEEKLQKRRVREEQQQRKVEKIESLSESEEARMSSSITDDIRAVVQQMAALHELGNETHPNSITNTVRSIQENNQEEDVNNNNNDNDNENINSVTNDSSSRNSAKRALPEPILDNDYFESRYGYSLLKKCDDDAASNISPITEYSQLDLWGEMPKYSRDMIFLYLISRRRNTFAVAYDYDGNRIHPTYTAGNRGLKGGDRGFRADGSSDNGHQVTSMYLNDLLPKIREMRASAGKTLRKDEKISLVVRVMGFYNGRQGAIRAVQDRANEFTVRYLEDITPYPLNGPKMPRGVFK